MKERRVGRDYAAILLSAMYTELPPPPSLREWIVCYWTLDGSPPAPVTVLPDGCADFIFDLQRNEMSVVGTMTRPLVVDDAQSGPLFGIRFRPGRISSFLRMPLSEITDDRVPLRMDLRVETIDGDLERHVRNSDLRVDAAVHHILRERGTSDIDELARSIGVSRQHLARLFAHHVGVSPKLFARIIRFRWALRLGRNAPWADVAAHLGYSDQSHLIADFREFAGESPVPFFLSTGIDAA